MSIRQYIGFFLLRLTGDIEKRTTYSRRPCPSDGVRRVRGRQNSAGQTSAHPEREKRLVRGDCTVVWRGEAWFIPRAYRPGAVVLCAPTRRGVYLRIQDPNKVQPDILAERASPAHSLPHSDHASCTEARWGTPTTSAPASSTTDARRARMPGSPLPAKGPGNTRRRTSGTAPSGHYAAANATPLAPPIHWCISRCNLCSCRPLWP